MMRSLSRRLGYLHDSTEARTTVCRWLDVGGPLADLTALGTDGITILRNVAPVAPQAVLAKIRKAATGQNADAITGMSARDRTGLIKLVKALAFEPEMFDDAALTLVRFVCAQTTDNGQNPARGGFTELFHLYLSGTQALIDQRISLARRLAKSSGDGERRCGMLALEGLLKSDHFSSAHDFDFGARPRDYGWQPQTQGDINDWYAKVIGLAVELKDIPEVSTVFARHIRSLWWSSGRLDDIDAAATAFSNGGVWIDGWLNFRVALRYDGKGMPDAVREQLERIIDRLKPVDLVDRARALILERSDAGYDVVDGEGDDAGPDSIHNAYRRTSEAAVSMGKAVAASPSDLEILLQEISSARQVRRAYEFGRGLAQGGHNLGEMWSALKAAYAAATSESRNPVTMAGFLAEAHVLDPDFVAPVLDAVIYEPDLAPLLPYLQAHVAMDEAGITRLRTAIANAALSSEDFWSIANGVIGDVPPSDLKDLLSDIAGLSGGVVVAIDVLYMYLFCHQNDPSPTASELIDVGRNLLLWLDLKDVRGRDWRLPSIIQRCLAGSNAEGIARQICQNVRSTLDAGSVSSYGISQMIDGLFCTQPIIALTEFFLGGSTNPNGVPVWMRWRNSAPIEKIAPEIVAAWADQDAGPRYKLLGQTLGILTKESSGNS